MRFPRVTPGLLLLMSGLCGCSQTGALRPTEPDNIRTTASVGDKALPVVAGAPGGSLRADTADPELPRTAKGRISGRVYDEEGRPASNAMVRLAVGADPGGKAVFAKTDRSGAFTLGGLRPGSAYTVIAEYQGEQGMMSGRADADAPDTNVRIGLHLRDAGIGSGGDVRSAARPDRSNVKSISRIEDIDDEEEPRDDTAAVNREDLAPPASDAAVALSRGEPRLSRVSKTADPDLDLDRVEPRRGWSSGARSSKPPRAEKPADPVFEDDGESEEINPLPPAIEVDKVSDRREQPPVRTAARSRARRPSQVAEESPLAAEADSISDEEASGAVADAPRPLPDGFDKGSRTVRSQAFAPLLLDEPDAAPPKTASPARSRQRPRPRSVEVPDAPEDGDPQAFQAKRPTWSELALQAGAIPLDEAIEKTAARSVATTAARIQPVETSVNRPARRTEGDASLTAAPRSFGRKSLAPSLLPQSKNSPFCEFDASEQRLIDFALPDVSGRMVSIRSLDADLILLDFWGTWCDKCLTSIPHLKELQSTLGGKRLQVVGVACEQKPANERAAIVSKVAKKLDINYTVLTTAMDGTCQVQDAFQIRVYPTMILLDRDGRILCRQEGATAATLAKIDSYIAKNLDREPAASAVAIGAKPAVRR
ncbi:redoxin domain-containing protein [Paludisphaera borealis]|uniref:Thiol-disulfide oxidoreductase ResA n=1 Tax=Paludisphaera borealis TaxID=1387353 RepID=A0A1U7CY81_9BACT|nr:redoxin domain-containing protein [Paludisphaera borealis]APW63907.1 Thiol-disulfide oxidoreductase ResA [Paludisphaera borealis]